MQVAIGLPKTNLWESLVQDYFAYQTSFHVTKPTNVKASKELARQIKVKVKIKVPTLDTVPLHSESPPQKRSGMARVLKGFHSFTCTPTRSSAVRMNHTSLCLPSRSWYLFTDPGGMEG